ncbi:hypothetical protein FNI11_14755 [Salmonella enterica subsp. salamae]|nr:hypothetical protein [Salmonella enterica subsp. salamae]ECJ2281774.1 hypothetical protein [Salmonella enterica subsp. salamae]
MLRVKRKQPSQWSLCRHASLCSSKQSGPIHKIIQVASQNACAGPERARLPSHAARVRAGAYRST